MKDWLQMKFAHSWLFTILFLILLTFSKTELHSQPIKKVILISNWNDTSCGVAEHSRHFAQSLTKKGVKVVKLDAFEVFADKSSIRKALSKIRKSRPDAVNIQYHPGLYMHMNSQINLFMKNLTRLFDIPTAISFHSEWEGMEKSLKAANLFIYYFKPKLTNLSNHSKSVHIPLPAPQFASSLSGTQLRSKYGYHDDDIIISTGGFAFGHKRVPEIISLLAPFLHTDSKIKLQLLVSPHQTNGDSLNELDKIREMISLNELEDQIYISGKFLETQEYLERLSISNVGFSWCPVGPYDSSAIEKDFVAVKVPLVVNNVDHNQLGTGEGVLRVKGELEDFTSAIISLAVDNVAASHLRQEMENSYSLLNYGHATSLHIKYFRKLNSQYGLVQ